MINFNDNYLDWLGDLLSGNVEVGLECLVTVR